MKNEPIEINSKCNCIRADVVNSEQVDFLLTVEDGKKVDRVCLTSITQIQGPVGAFTAELYLSDFMRHGKSQRVTNLPFKVEASDTNQVKNPSHGFIKIQTEREDPSIFIIEFDVTYTN